MRPAFHFLRRSIDVAKSAVKPRTWLAILAGALFAFASQSPQLIQGASVQVLGGVSQKDAGVVPRVEKQQAKKQSQTPTDGSATCPTLAAISAVELSAIRLAAKDIASESIRRHPTAQPRAPPSNLI